MRRRSMNTSDITRGGVVITSLFPYDQMRTNKVFCLQNGKNYYEHFNDDSFQFVCSSNGNTPHINIKIDAIASDYRVILYSDAKKSDMEALGKGSYIYKVDWIGSPFFINLAYGLAMNEIYTIYKDMGFDLMIDNNQYLSLYI